MQVVQARLSRAWSVATARSSMGHRQQTRTARAPTSANSLSRPQRCLVGQPIPSECLTVSTRVVGSQRSDAVFSTV